VAHRARDQDGEGGQQGEDHAAVHPAVEEAEVESQAGLRLRRRHPLEEPAVGDVEAGQRAQDGVRHQPRLVGEEDHRQRHLHGGDADVAGEGEEVAPLGDAAAVRQQPADHPQDSPAPPSWPARTASRAPARRSAASTRPPG